MPVASPFAAMSPMSPMPSKLCVVALGPTMADLRAQRDSAVEADLVELRLDTVADLSVDGALAGRRTPVIATCRAPWEGGAFQGSEEERHRILARALDLGADYVDVEWRAGFRDLLSPERRDRVVLSSHDFEGMPADLLARARDMYATGAGVVKIAATAACLTDCVRLLEVSRAFDAPSRVLIAMGPSGEVTRVCAAAYGSLWTYAGVVPGIGQIPPGRLVSEYRFGRITPATKRYGITGLPVTHSVSPAMHNAAFRAHGLDAVYLSLPAADADDFVAFARGLELAGASVTLPYKVDLATRVDDLDPVACRVGAINTIRMDDAGWHGANTDVAGFLAPLSARRIPLSGARAAVLGAGGSSRAVVTALVGAGVTVTVHARRAGAAAAVAQPCGAAVGAWPVPPGSWDLLVNCTPVGMYPAVDDSPIAPEALTGATVYDLVYNPQRTRLLRDARDAGCEAIGGLEMLVAQAQDQFHAWTGIRPDAAVMERAALARLAEFTTHEDHHA